MTSQTRLALLLVAALALVSAGVFLALQGRNASNPPAPTPDVSTEEEVPAEDVMGLAADAVPVPEGFTLVPAVRPEPLQEFTAAEDVLEDGLDYYALIETTKGEMLIDLYEDRVPATVNNFVFLARNRFYEDVTFHRVIEDFMAQAGDPTGTGAGGPGYRFDDEIDPELKHDAAGILSMANAGPNTNGSQFFITMNATPWLDGAHAVFGSVVDGIEVLDVLNRVEPQSPQIIGRLQDDVQVLIDQGIAEAEGFEGTVEAWLTQQLGAMPNGDLPFRVADRRAVLGTAGGAPALGLFENPDRMLRVTILTRNPEEDPS